MRCCFHLNCMALCQCFSGLMWDGGPCVGLTARDFWSERVWNLIPSLRLQAVRFFVRTLRGCECDSSIIPLTACGTGLHKGCIERWAPHPSTFVGWCVLMHHICSNSTTANVGLVKRSQLDGTVWKHWGGCRGGGRWSPRDTLKLNSRPFAF